MIQILRDNIWTFIFGILGIGLAVYFYLRQRQRKSLSYRVLAKTPLFIMDESVKGRLHVTLDGNPVIEPYLVLLKIINDGNTPITSADFEKPLSFSFGGETSIKSREITDSFPKTLRPNLEIPPKVNVQPTRVVIESVLWNPGDSITLKFLLSRFQNGVIECDSRIVGVKEVKDVTPKESDRILRNQLMLQTVLFAALVLAIASAVYLMTIIEPLLNK